MKYYFDILHIRQFQEGYQLEVGISRPENAPKYRHTEADRKRRSKVAKVNYKLAMENKLFNSIDELFGYVDELNGEATVLPEPRQTRKFRKG